MGIHDNYGASRVPNDVMWDALIAAGFTPDEAVTFVAIALAESGGISNNHNPKGEDSLGLWQINRDAHPWATNDRLATPAMMATAAKRVYDEVGGSIDRWTVTHTKNGTETPKYLSFRMEAQMTAADKGYPEASGHWQGVSGYGVTQSGAGDGTTSAPGPTSGSGIGPMSTATEPGLPGNNDKYPPGGTLMNTGYAPVLRYQLSPGVHIEFVITDLDALARSGYDLGSAIQYIPPHSSQILIDYKDTGDASAIGDLGQSGKTMQEIWEEILDRYFSKNDPARQDQGVLGVIAWIVANPDATEGQIQIKLGDTDYYDKMTDAARAWTGKSKAQQDAEVDAMAKNMADDMWRLFGVRVDFADPDLRDAALSVASGLTTYSSWYAEQMDLAEADPESPHSRSIRNEEIARGEFDATGENLADDLESSAIAWGIQLSPDQAAQWAEDIQMNVRTQADFDDFLKDQAMILYPWKDRETRTLDAATPWTTAYQRILETATPNLENPMIQEAMQKGMPLFDFEKKLRADPKWLKTGNAQDDFTRVAGDLARAMGFE